MRKLRKVAVTVLATTTTLASISACRNGTPTDHNTHPASTASHERRDGHRHSHGHHSQHLGSLPRITMTWPSDGPGDQAAGRYQQMIVALRQTGRQYHGIYETQPRSNTGVIHLEINTPHDGPLILWFTAHDLYLQGFQNNEGRIFYFRDFQIPLAMRQMSFQPAEQLPFGGSYTELERAAHRGRMVNPPHDPGLGFDYGGFSEAIRGLAYTRPGADMEQVARRLMLMIQFTSESARFTEVNTRMRNAMRTNTSSGLNLREVGLENDWSRISNFARQILERPHNTSPITVRNVGTLRNWRDVRRILRLVLSFNPRPGSQPQA
jgi:Ribosome inactivating protein